MKKLLLAFAAAAVILTVVIAVLYFRSPVETIDLGGEDALYPYTCELKHQKLSVQITGEFPDGYRWSAQTETGDVLSVRGKKQNSKIAVFRLKPLGSGIGKVTFTLEKPAELPDRIYEIGCTFLLGSDGEVESAESACLALSGLDSGSGGDFTYHVAQLNPYTLLFSVSGEGTWSCERVGVLAELNGSMKKTCVLPDSDASTQELTVVSANREGSGTLYIDGADGKHIEVYYECTDMGEISLTGHALGSGDSSVRVDPFDRQYGNIGKRLEALLGEGEMFMSRLNSLADEDKSYPIGVIEFSDPTRAWKLSVSSDATEADFVGKAEPISEVTAAGITAGIFESEIGLRGVWRAEGMTCLLEFTEADRASCEELAASVLKTLFS